MRRRCPPTCRPTHRSLFDGSLQGLAFKDRPAFSFQGHPEASPGPHDVKPLFERFNQLDAAGGCRTQLRQASQRRAVRQRSS